MVTDHAGRAGPAVQREQGLQALTGADYKAHGVSKSFANVTVLHDVTVHFRRGEIHSIIGENGAGKSTLLRILAGMFPATQGELVLNGTILPALTPRDAQRHGIYLVPQEPRLMPDLSVAENLYLGALPRRFGAVAWRRMIGTTEELITSVGLRADPRLPAGRLSLAQQQLLECARALSHGCGTIFFDEPTSPLTARDAERLFELMWQMRDQGLTLGFISHRLDEIEAVSDRITVLRDGSVVARAERGSYTRENLVTAMIGRTLTISRRSRRTAEPGAVMLDVDELVAPPEVSGMSIRVRRGGGRGPCRARRQRAYRVRRGAIRHPPPGERHRHGERPEHHRRQPAQVHRPRPTSTSPRTAAATGYSPMSTSPATRRRRSWGSCRERRARSSGPGRNSRSPGRPRIEMDVRGSSVAAAMKTLSGGNQQKALLARWMLAHPLVGDLRRADPRRGHRRQGEHLRHHRVARRERACRPRHLLD